MFSDLNPNTYNDFYKKNLKTVFLAIPSNYFYLRADISAFVLNQGLCPLNPYMNFDYNLLNTIPKKITRIANNNLIKKSDELWVFCEDPEKLTDGVLFEIYLANKENKKIKYFLIPDFKELKINLQGSKEHYGNELLNEDWKIVYTAMSSKLFYYRNFISKFALDNKVIPLNPFTSFDYFLADKTNRNSILLANSRFIELADELWSFGKLSDGIQAEIKLVKSIGKKVRYFKTDKKNIIEIKEEDAELEN